jgi:hypothetical protein
MADKPTDDDSSESAFSDDEGEAITWQEALVEIVAGWNEEGIPVAMGLVEDDSQVLESINKRLGRIADGLEGLYGIARRMEARFFPKKDK